MNQEIDFQVAGLSPRGERWKIRHLLFPSDGKKAAQVDMEGGWLDLKKRELIAPSKELEEI